MRSIEISLSPDGWYIATLGGVAQWSWGGPAIHQKWWTVKILKELKRGTAQVLVGRWKICFYCFRSISVGLQLPLFCWGNAPQSSGGAILVGFFWCQGTPGMRVSSRRCRGAALHGFTKSSKVFGFPIPWNFWHKIRKACWLQCFFICLNSRLDTMLTWHL